MTFPRHTAKFLEGIPFDEEQDVLAQGVQCAGAKFHSPNPLLVHPCQIEGETVYLCGVCRDNVRILRLLKAEHGTLPWVLLREFGNQTRTLAMSAEGGG